MSNDEIQPPEEISISNEMDEWVAEIGARHILLGFSHLTRPSMDSNLEKEPSIFGNWQCWDDFGVSFLHQIFACMTNWYDLNVRSYLEYLQKKEALAWSYYRGVNKQFCAENSKRFIEHRMVNSCFLIFVMLFYSGEENEKVIMDKVNDQNSYPIGLTVTDINSSLKFVTEDSLQIFNYLFTMKYQVPWVFVEAVYTEFSNLSKLCVIPIHKLARLFMKDIKPNEHLYSKVDGNTVPEGGFKHILHIFHWSRQPDEEYVLDSTSRCFNSFHIPSATKLQLSQTVFEKDMGATIDMSYSNNKRVSAVIQLTPWYINPLKRVLYESLLRLEAHHPDCEMHFTAHFACLACLLKTEADVQVLRERGVIHSTRFDDKDVLLCVQELKTFINGQLILPNKLATLEKNVMAHHKKSVYRVIGEFKQRYCSNTWIRISFIAGILLFVLTFIQTLYGTLSYYKQ